MSSVAINDARGIIATLIGMQPPGSKLKHAWPRVARLTGLGERRLRAVWHREPIALRADEMDALRAALATKKPKTTVADSADRLEAVARSLEATDADFHRHEIDRLRDVVRRIRRSLAGSVQS